jgi:hypothetical protein
VVFEAHYYVRCVQKSYLRVLHIVSRTGLHGTWLQVISTHKTYKRLVTVYITHFVVVVDL